ncbi:hypothetical protein [Streptomyces erythrochromogenes]|uniref:hypothetical protein n=1 Tax=Streptomyces erythrochromogenes TaxID=285574 RepID=UPI00341D5CC0
MAAAAEAVGSADCVAGDAATFGFLSVAVAGGEEVCSVLREQLGGEDAQPASGSG